VSKRCSRKEGVAVGVVAVALAEAELVFAEELKAES
jgi:hypothetical protein